MDEADRTPGRTRRRLRHLKYEVARDLGLDDDIARRGWGGMTTREVGRIGGQMVRRLVRRGERALAEEDDRAD